MKKTILAIAGGLIVGIILTLIYKRHNDGDGGTRLQPTPEGPPLRGIVIDLTRYETDQFTPVAIAGRN